MNKNSKIDKFLYYEKLLNHMETIIGKKGSIRRITLLSILALTGLFLLIYSLLGVFGSNFYTDSIANNSINNFNSSGLINISIPEANLYNFTFNWNGSDYLTYDSSLLAFYNFDNVSALGDNYTALKVVDVGLFNTTGAFTSNDGRVSFGDGKYGKGIILPSLAGYISVNFKYNVSTNDTGGLSFCIWNKMSDNITNNQTGLVNTRGSVTPNGGANSFQIARNWNGTNWGLYYLIYDTSASTWTGTKGLAGTSYDNLDWQYWCFTGDNTLWTLWINGVNVTQSTRTKYVANFSGVTLGYASYGTNHYMNGSIDEFKIWNTTLTANEIKKEYESSLNKKSLTQWDFVSNITGLSDGTYTYYGSSSNSSGFVNSTETRTLRIDTLAPTISFQGSTPSNNSYQNTNSLFINVSITEANPSNITFVLANQSGIINTTIFSMSSQTSNNTINFSLGNEGVYYFNATIIDQVNQQISTETRTFNKDAVNPSISLTSPTATTYTKPLIDINFTSSDSNSLNYWWTIDGGLNNFSISKNRTIPFSNGTKTLTIYANDTAGNTNSSTVSFSVSLSQAHINVYLDLQNLVDGHSSRYCTDATNLSYGSILGCRVNSSQTYALNYHTVVATISSYAYTSSNKTLLNLAKQLLLSTERLQEDTGDFPVENVDQLQDPSYAPVQTFILMEGVGDAYKLLEDELNSTEKAKLKRMWVDYVNYITITKSEITYENAFTGSNRMSDVWNRKQLNISFAEFNKSDNWHLAFRADKEGNPTGYITMFIGNDSSQNYTYDVRYANVDMTDVLEIPLNKSNIASACSSTGTEYICNFTFVRNTAWSIGNGYLLKRANEMSPNQSWTSSDGVTWTVQNREHFTRLYYYDNTTLDRTTFLQTAGNQIGARAFACKQAYDILSQDNDYPISTNIAQRCYLDNTQQLLQNSKDGVYNEVNGMLRINTDNTKPLYSGYAPNYQYLSAYHLARLYLSTGNTTYLTYLNTSINSFSSYFIYGNDMVRSSGFGSRSASVGSDLDSMGVDNLHPMTIAFIGLMDGTSTQANLLSNYTKSYVRYYPTSNFSLAQKFVDGALGLDGMYKYFPTSSISSGTLNSDQSTYLHLLNNTGLYTLSTANYRVFGSFRNSTSSGGVIGDVHLRPSLQHLFSGNVGDHGNNSFGLGSLVSGNIGAGGYSNAYDVHTTVTVLSATYPYKLNFYGNLTKIDITQKSPITYNTTYTFYDTYIEVNQTTSSAVELQLWSVSSEAISGSLTSNTPLVLDNSTILPMTFSGKYQDTTEQGSWDTIDKINATGTNFHYYIGIKADTTSPEYFEDIQGRRLALPIWVTNTTTTKKYLGSNITGTVNNITANLNVTGIIPDKPRFTSHTGANTKTYQNTEYIYNSTSKFIEINISGIEYATGSNELLLDANPPVVSLGSPEAGTQDTDGVIRFTFSAIETNNISNCSLNYGSGTTYQTLTNLQNGTSNLIEVVSVNNQHVLYSDDLKWYVSCTDNSGNVGTSETRSLDTKADTTGGTQGGGTTTGGDDPTSTSTEDPKYFNVNYPDTWNRGSTITVKVSAYNQSNSIYPPKSVKFEFSINGIVLEQTGTNSNNEVIATFKVLNSAEAGEKTIKVIVEDDRTVSQEMKFTIDDGITVTTISGDKTTVDKYMWWILWGFVGMFALIFFVILLVALTRDAKR
jgi:hypothetical protein